MLETLNEKYKGTYSLDKRKCIECGGCVSVCPFAALELGKNGIIFDRNSCTLCAICEKACPVNCIKVVKNV